MPVGLEMRRTESDIPREALASIQQGTIGFTYRDVLCQKSPFDLALYSRLLFESGARSVIEIGSSQGGSALWFADALRSYARAPEIVSIDVNPVSLRDPQIRFLQGNALSLGDALPPSLLQALPRPWLVVEDSAHFFETSLAVLEFFDGWMAHGEYVVVEDGIVNDLEDERYARFENGPNRAIQTFLSAHPDRYEIDERYCDYFGHNYTWNPNGWLRRI